MTTPEITEMQKKAEPYQSDGKQNGRYPLQWNLPGQWNALPPQKWYHVPPRDK
jgi:hypothetical protein